MVRVFNHYVSEEQVLLVAEPATSVGARFTWPPRQDALNGMESAGPGHTNKVRVMVARSANDPELILEVKRPT